VAKAAKALNKATSGQPAKKVTDRASETAGFDRLGDEVRNLAGATATWALSSAIHKLDGLTDRLGDTAKGGPGALKGLTGGGGSGGGGLVKNLVKKAAGAGISAVTGGKDGPGKKGGGKQPKVTNIVETIDVGVPVRLAYDQWTRFTEFPRFTKKVEDVAQEADEKLVWRAKIFWSRRSWESTIIEQVPDQRIIWRSKGAKGHVDGAVTFHELTPDLTRIVLVLEYHPQGLFERTGNIWQAQGRRARLELKHFRRHVMTQSLLHPDEVEGWRGEIRDGEVVAESDRDEDQDELRDEEQDEEELPDEDQDEKRDEKPAELRDEDRDEEQDQDRDEDRDEERDTARSKPARAKGSRTAGGRARTTKTRRPATNKSR
jgi:uncharacterized membrane protein